MGGGTGRRTRFVVLEMIPWIARARRSPAKSARVPTHNEEECELGQTNPSLAHRRQGNDAQAAQKLGGALEECAGAAAAENEKRTVLWYVKADYD